MRLVPISADLVDTAAGWMADKANYQWLDFGNGVQILSAAALRIMAQRDLHVLRVFMPDDEDVPLGVVALANVDRAFCTATAWTVLGNKTYRRNTGNAPSASRALSKLLTFGFTELGLKSVHVWAVESNTPSLRLIERLKFRYIGRQRRCHWIDGRPQDRLLFDLLASEHEEL